MIRHRAHYPGLKQELTDMFFGGGRFKVSSGIKEIDEGHHQAFVDSMKNSKTIVFPAEQAEVFCDMVSSYTETLDYQLPFNEVFLQFTNPVAVDFPGRGQLALECMLLLRGIKQEDEREETYNIAFSWFDDKQRSEWAMLPHVWRGSTEQALRTTTDQDFIAIRMSTQSLAIACIGYINCENIFLHKEGGAPEAVNRKRERQGKKILEPYYVCRIKGVQYDSNGNAIGEGTQHGFRYDVRGHFRKLTTGKTTWVRPHQRGVHNELYIPKTYVVAKETPKAELLRN